MKCRPAYCDMHLSLSENGLLLLKIISKKCPNALSYCVITTYILTEFSAPLALKDPVFCKFSHLKNASLPINLLKVELVKTGVL